MPRLTLKAQVLRAGIAIVWKIRVLIHVNNLTSPVTHRTLAVAFDLRGHLSPLIGILKPTSTSDTGARCTLVVNAITVLSGRTTKAFAFPVAHEIGSTNCSRWCVRRRCRAGCAYPNEALVGRVRLVVVVNHILDVASTIALLDMAIALGLRRRSSAVGYGYGGAVAIGALAREANVASGRALRVRCAYRPTTGSTLTTGSTFATASPTNILTAFAPFARFTTRADTASAAATGFATSAATATRAPRLLIHILRVCAGAADGQQRERAKHKNGSQEE